MTEELVDAVANLKEEEALRIAKEKLGAGEDPVKILELFRRGVETVGKRFEDGEYFLSHLILAGEILNGIMEIIKPTLEKVTVKRLGKVVIGTVQSDIHDIGKNVVMFMLDANGFEVHDLGVDVPPQKFVDKIREVKPEVVGLCGLLTVAYDSMKRTVEALKEAGLRDKVKIMIGGGQANEDIAKYVGADAYGKDAVEAVSLCKRWMDK